MISFQVIKQFQGGLQGRNFVSLRTAFGANFVQWFDIIRRVLFVAKKLACPNPRRVEKSLSKCFRLLSEFRWSQHDWNVREYLQTLEQFDLELSRLFMQIVAGVMHHLRFSDLIQGSRRFFQEGERQDLNPGPQKSLSHCYQVCDTSCHRFIGGGCFCKSGPNWLTLVKKNDKL